ncbi:hypothetical protein AX16_005484, partial [Volvariella volvacea WC 439]
MRSTKDPIRGLQRYIEEWGLATEQELKKLDKEAKAEAKDLWTDIYYKGTEPPYMRNREQEE